MPVVVGQGWLEAHTLIDKADSFGPAMRLQLAPLFPIAMTVDPAAKCLYGWHRGHVVKP